LFVVLLVMAPPSQELEPPINPGRFNPASEQVIKLVVKDERQTGEAEQ
jgi:hypothetical protein